MDIDVQVRNRVMFATLNRPAVLNALSFAMIRDLGRALRASAADPGVRALVLRGAGEKAFCAGGDIRALYESHRSGDDSYLDFFIEEYRLDYFLHGYPKPLVAVLDGITMGGGMGLGQGASLRLVGERTRIAMPEVGIGLIPDVGASYFLSRLPGALGVYLALTGSEIRASDAVYARLADLYLARASVLRLETAMTGISWSGDWNGDVIAAIGALADAPPAPAPLESLRPAIDRHFSQSSVPAILASLQTETQPEWRAWAEKTAQLLGRRSPTMLEVTLRQLELGKRLSLADCFRMEFGLVRQCFAQGDILEGVRALIVDKDNRPQWRPARIEEVTRPMVDAFLQGVPPGDRHPLAEL